MNQIHVGDHIHASTTFEYPWATPGTGVLRNLRSSIDF